MKSSYTNRVSQFYSTVYLTAKPETKHHSNKLHKHYLHTPNECAKGSARYTALINTLATFLHCKPYCFLLENPPKS